MNKPILSIILCCTFFSVVSATEIPKESKSNNDTINNSNIEQPFKPSVQVGGFLQVQGVGSQDRPLNPLLDGNRRWSKQAQIWRARFMVGGAITRKASFFMQTELPAPLGFVSDSGVKQIQNIAPIILDAQIQYEFNKFLAVRAGMQLVGISRNGLQSPVTLMGLDFGLYQYPYNLFQDQPLQNNFGRDIGVNARGFLFKERLEWRAGLFRGRGVDQYSPFRTVVRFNYSFLDREKGLYYTGTTLGKEKVFSIGGGLDAQGSYISTALDAFLDLPVGELGSVTWQGSYMYLNGGRSNSQKSFTPLIPKQSVFFTELGFYFPKVKLQPYLKFETQKVNISEIQYEGNQQRVLYGLSDQATTSNLSTYNTLTSNSRFGGGLNYYVDDFNFHIKLQYEQIFYGRFNSQGKAETHSGGEVKLQFTYFLFQ